MLYIVIYCYILLYIVIYCYICLQYIIIFPLCDTVSFPSYFLDVFIAGSIQVSFYVEGRQSAVSSALNALWTRLEEGFTLQFDGRNLTARKEMLVDNEPFYGTSVSLRDQGVFENQHATENINIPIRVYSYITRMLCHTNT